MKSEVSGREICLDGIFQFGDKGVELVAGEDLPLVQEHDAVGSVEHTA